jgi:hypothetical protein
MSLLERLESDDLEHKLVFPMENDGSRMFSFGGMSFDSSSENILQESDANNTYNTLFLLKLTNAKNHGTYLQEY